jgi:Na+-driven multidrug efflux pump
VLAFGGASALSAYFTNHAGQPRVPAQVAALSLGINAALSLLLIPQFGMNGAALAASTSYALTVALLLQRFRRHAGLSWRQVLVPELALLRQDGRALLRALRLVSAAPATVKGDR